MLITMLLSDLCAGAKRLAMVHRAVWRCVRVLARVTGRCTATPLADVNNWPRAV